MSIKKLLLFIFIIFVLALNLILLYTQSIRLDESQSIWTATKPIPALLENRARDVHVPLYFVLLHFWIQIFGIHIVSVRTLSLIFFIMALPIIYIVTKESSNKSVALLTLILIALSPFVMWFTLEARMYTLLIFATMLGHLFFLRMFHTEGKSGKFEYLISAVIGLYTHYFFIFFLFSQSVYVLISVINQRKKEFAYKYFLVLTGAALFFAPWLLYVYKLGAAEYTKPMIPKPTSFNIFQTITNYLFGFQSYTVQAILVSLWPLVLILFFAVFTQRRYINIRNIEYFIMTTFIPVLVVFMLSYIRPIFLPRYLIFITPTLFFIFAWLILNAAKRLTYAIVSILLAMMVMFLLYQNSSASTPVREDYRQVTEYLTTTATPKDIIAVTAPFTIYPLEYYYRGQARIATIPEWNRYEEGPIPPYSQEQLGKQFEKFEGNYDRVFVIFSYNQGYEENIKQYLDSHYQRLDKRAFSASIELRVYKTRY